MSDEDINIKMTSFLQKTCRIVSGKKELSVFYRSINNAFAAFAASNRADIFLDLDDIRSKTESDVEFMTDAKAYSYHELAHILFTSYQNHGMSDELKKVINMLEDCRIENLMSLRFGNANKFFKYLVLKNFSGSGSIISFILLYGRMFIKRSIVDKFGASISFDKIEDLKKLIDVYNLTTKGEDQIEIAKEVYKLLGGGLGGRIDYKQGQGEVSSKRSNEKLSKKLINKVAEAIEARDKARDINSKSEESSVEEDIEARESSLKAIEREFESSKEETDLEIIEEIKDVFGDKSISGYWGDDVVIEEKQLNAEPEHYAASNKIYEMLINLRKDKNPSYLKKRTSGIIDTRLAMKEDNSLKIFKKFKHSRVDKAKMAISILLDSSSSMGSGFYKILDSAWILSNSVERVGEKVMVTEYSTKHKIIKGFDSRKGDWRRHYESGTSPLNAIVESFKYLMSRTENNKVMFIFTDGEWEEEERCSSIIKKMDRNGILTIFVSPYTKMSGRGCKLYFKIDKFEDFIKVMKEVIKDIQQKAVEW